MSRYVAVLAALAYTLILPQHAFAADSYRWLRVTIETPWAIFLFLLPMVLTPIILMAILYWRFALRPSDQKNQPRTEKKDKKISDEHLR